MNTKEAMDKDISFTGLWKYIKPLVPVYKKLGNDWADMADDDGVMVMIGMFAGLFGTGMGIGMVLSSFHLFFFITIPIGLIVTFLFASLLWFTLMGLLGKVSWEAQRFNLKDWTYSVGNPLEKPDDQRS